MCGGSTRDLFGRGWGQWAQGGVVTGGGESGGQAKQATEQYGATLSGAGWAGEHVWPW